MPGQMTISGNLFATRHKPALRAALVIIALAPCAMAAGPAPAANLTTSAPRLDAVVIEGSSVYQAPRLFTAYRDTLGREISRDSARAVTDALASLYETDGYVRPEFQLDNSLTGRGVLRVQVFEAQVTQVLIEGDCGGYRDALEEIAARLTAAKPLRKNDLQRSLAEMRQIAGLAITANTRRDTRMRNAFELVLKSEYSPFDGLVRMNNRGTDQVGPAFVLGQAFANGMFNRQEKIGLIFAAATDHEEYLGGGLFADAPVGSNGTRINSLLFRSRSAPNEAPVNLDDEYTRARATLRVLQPLLQESASSLSMTAAFEADDLTIDRLGVDIREDRLRIVEAGLRGTWRGAGAMQYTANLALRKGLDALGAGLQAHDLADDPRRADFLVMQLSGTVYRRFATDWSLRFDGFAQNSGYVLPDSERFKIGGDRLGRGFEVAEIVGDRGIGGKLELRRDLLNTEGMFGRLSTYGFYDIGAAWKQDRPGREAAATAGVGFALQGAVLTGYCALAAPLTGPDIEGSEAASIFAELSYRF